LTALVSYNLTCETCTWFVKESNLPSRITVICGTIRQSGGAVTC
jgi:hypothetical protein